MSRRFPIDHGVLSGAVAAAAIVVTWGLLLGLLALLGRSVVRLVVPAYPPGVLTCCWVGFTVYLGYVLLWHLVLPADGWAWAPVVAVAAVEVWRSRARVTGWLTQRRASGRGYWLAAAAVLVASLWLAHLSVQQPYHYDSGLYHLQAIQWAGAHPVVPGLANLHFRLGFTSAWWPFASSLGLGPWAGHQAHLETGMVLSLLFAEHVRCLLGVVRLRALRPDLVLGVLLLPVTASQVSFGWVSSPGYDQSLYAFQVAAAIYALRALVVEGRLGPVAVLLATAAVLMRLQAAPFSLGLCVVLLLSALRDRAAGRQRLRALVVAGGVGVIGTAAYLATGIIGSGYPFFPLSVAGLPVDWRVPVETAAAVERDIREVARLTPGGSTGWDWVEPWFRYNLGVSTFKFGLGLLACALVLLLVVAAAAPRRVARTPHVLALGGVLASGLLGLGAWFVVSPDPRLGLGAIWVPAGAAFIVAVAVLDRPGFGGWSRRAAWTVAPAAVLLLSAQAVWSLSGSGQLWPTIAAGDGPFGVIAPAEPATHEVGPAGSRYRVPDSGDQCWSAPVPCAPSERPELEQRGTDIRDGYRVRSGE